MDEDGTGESQPPRRLWPWWLAGAVLLLAALAVLGIAAFPFEKLRAPLEKKLSRELGRPASIGAIVREERLSFTPALQIRNIRIPEPEWAGDGDLAIIDQLRLRVSVFDLLRKRINPSEISIDGGHLRLVRTKEGKRSWRLEQEKAPRKEPKKRKQPGLDSVSIRNFRLIYEDAKRDRSAHLVVSADKQGILAFGPGKVMGHDIALSLAMASPKAGPKSSPKSGEPQVFRAIIAGKALSLGATGSLDQAFDFSKFDINAEAWADDLKLIDALIEAGLFGTQKVHLKTRVRRENPYWHVHALEGTIGRSDIRGTATVEKAGDRTLLTGEIHSDAFDFDDLSTDEDRARAMAERKRLGPRLVPGLRINLAKLGKTDGEITLHAKTLLWPGSSPFRSLDGTLRLDHGVLTVAPLSFGLPHGTLNGTIQVDHRDTEQLPELSIDVRLQKSRIRDFFDDSTIDGALSGAIRLSGRGNRFREAVGRSTGRIGLVATNNNPIAARTASLLGADVGRALTVGKKRRAEINCIIGVLDVRNGVARPDPMLIDTSRSRLDVSGNVQLSDERLYLKAKGAPKRKSLLRLRGNARIGGTIRKPRLTIEDMPQKGSNVGKALKITGRAVGDLVGGKQTPLAKDADCKALRLKALNSAA